MPESVKRVEVQGHLVDSNILGNIMTRIMDLGGDFEIITVNIGRQKSDTSHAVLEVKGKDEAHLQKLLDSVYREGASEARPEEARLEAAPKDMTMPENFYSTTNNRTQVYRGGKWLDAGHMMMDKCIVVSDDTATCTAIRDIRSGDMIVVGESGVRVIPPERPREGTGTFEFMSSSSSSERPTQHMARRVAESIRSTKESGGRIILVGGPAIVHTGAAESVAGLVRDGYIDGVLAGNALAVHDIEYATIGTSLGMNVSDGTLAVRGHRNHMDTVNAVFKAGSIRNMVKSKDLTRGIMYECIVNDVPFVLAGSIRDDGPLPDVITDVTLAQKKYKEILRDAQMVIMVSTMLHSIATGNMIPADIKVVIVDISQPTVTKLMDRGTWQAVGIVTDVGAFLPMVADHLARWRRDNPSS